MTIQEAPTCLYGWYPGGMLVEWGDAEGKGGGGCCWFTSRGRNAGREERRPSAGEGTGAGNRRICFPESAQCRSRWHSAAARYGATRRSPRCCAPRPSSRLFFFSLRSSSPSSLSPRLSLSFLSSLATYYTLTDRGAAALYSRCCCCCSRLYASL